MHMCSPRHNHPPLETSPQIRVGNVLSQLGKDRYIVLRHERIIRWMNPHCHNPDKGQEGVKVVQMTEKGMKRGTNEATSIFFNK